MPSTQIHVTEHTVKLYPRNQRWFQFFAWHNLENWLCPLTQGSPASRIECLMIWGGANHSAIKYVINVMHWIVPKASPLLWSMEKSSSMKLVPGAKKVGDHCFSTMRFITMRLSNHQFITMRWPKTTNTAMNYEKDFVFQLVQKASLTFPEGFLADTKFMLQA